MSTLQMSKIFQFFCVKQYICIHLAWPNLYSSEDKLRVGISFILSTHGAKLQIIIEFCSRIKVVLVHVHSSRSAAADFVFDAEQNQSRHLSPSLHCN